MIQFSQMLEKGCWWTHSTKNFLQKHKDDHKLIEIISDFVNFWPQFCPKKHYNQKIKISTIWSLEIRDWWKNNQLSSFITEKWLNLSDLNNQNNLACFNRIILYCYVVVRTVITEAINSLVSKKIVQWIDLERLQNIDQNLTSR